MSKFEAAKQRFDSPPGSGAFSQRFHATQAMFDDLHENLRADSLCFHRTFSPISDGARAAMEGGVQSRFCSRFGVEIHCGPDTGTVQHRHHRLS